MSKQNKYPHKKKVLSKLVMLVENNIAEFATLPKGYKQIPFPSKIFLNTIFTENDDYARNALAELSFMPEDKPFQQPCLKFYFGSPWTKHGLHSPSPFWWRMPSEPDITQLLLKVFTPTSAMVGRVRRHRGSEEAPVAKGTPEAFVFLQAIAASVNTQIEGLELPVAYTDIYHVQAEVRTDKGNYLDMLLRWQKGAEQFALAIEIKFGAKLVNDLADYETITARTPRSQKYHIVLGCKDELADYSVNKNWTFCYWLDVLRHWENFLEKQQEACSENGCLLRNILWHKIGGCKWLDNT